MTAKRYVFILASVCLVSESLLLFRSCDNKQNTYLNWLLWFWWWFWKSYEERCRWIRFSTRNRVFWDQRNERSDRGRRRDDGWMTVWPSKGYALIKLFCNKNRVLLPKYPLFANRSRFPLLRHSRNVLAKGCYMQLPVTTWVTYFKWFLNNQWHLTGFSWVCFSSILDSFPFQFQFKCRVRKLVFVFRILILHNKP